MQVLDKKANRQPSSKVTIVNLDPRYRKHSSTKDEYHLVTEIDLNIAKNATKILLLSPESELLRVTDFVRIASEKKHLSAFLIRQDLDRIFPLLREAQIRSIFHMLPYKSNALPERIIRAWINGEQNDTIAQVTVQGHELLVETCAFERLRVPFAAIGPLAEATAHGRAIYTLSPYGRYIHWPKFDLHVDLEGLRTILDPKLAEAAKTQRLLEDKFYGQAIAVLRSRHGLRQEDITGLSGRTIRRIEAGEYPATSSSLELLAKAHGLEPNDYMQKVASVMYDLKGS